MYYLVQYFPDDHHRKADQFLSLSGLLLKELERHALIHSVCSAQSEKIVLKYMNKYLLLFDVLDVLRRTKLTFKSKFCASSDSL